MSGLLGTQLRIVLHFTSKDMPWEGSIVLKHKRRLLVSPRLAVKEELACFPGGS